MQSRIDKIDEIELKIRQLVGKLKELKQENMSLQENNTRLKKEIENVKLNIEGMKSEETQVRELKVQHNGNLFDKQDIRSEIDTYIEEIDKCIEILKVS